MLTMFDDDDSVRAALRAGARGYVLKGAGQHDIVRAIHAVAAGDAILAPGVAHAVLGGVASAADPFPDLTPRERQVLELLAEGMPAGGDRRPARPRAEDRHEPRVGGVRQARRGEPGRGRGPGPPVGVGRAGPVGSPAVPVYALGDVETDIHPDAYVHPDAVVIGDVTELRRLEA